MRSGLVGIGVSALAVSFGVVGIPRGAWAQVRLSRPAFAGKLTPCRVNGVDEDVLCGKRQVYEDRAAQTGRTISLTVVVLPATTDSVLGDPVVFLAGGGVVPATRYARFLSSSLPTLRRHRDIVLADQRGTGASNPLTCDRATLDTAVSLPFPERYLRFIAACRASLATRADVRFYTTPLAIRDLDDVRAWLGYERLNLYAASYGTSVAAAYIRAYPTRVRAVAMHGVVPLDAPMQIDLARSAQQALERVFALCAADLSCHTTFPDPHVDLTRAFARFDATAADAPPAQRQTIGQPFRDALNTALSTATGIRSVPMLLHGAADGVLPPPEGAPAGPEPPPLGVRLAILCSEGLSAIDTAAISRETARTFLGEFPVRFQLRWCEGWPTAPLPADFRAPFRSNVPALLLVGDLDPITPPAYAEHVATWFSNSTVLRLPYRSHSDTDSCITGMIERFIVEGGRAPDSTCLAASPRIAFTTAR